MKASALAFIGIFFLALAAPVEAQQLCGGVSGTPCASGQFCELPDGQCCCNIVGACAGIPASCPAVCDPVCGCDGQTYESRCEAQAAGMSVLHTGPCASDRTVELTAFTPMQRLWWEPLPGATAYNVYVQELDFSGQFFGSCLYSAVPEDSVLLKGDPKVDQPWLIRISGLLPSGEGPIGSGACQPAPPPVPCTCSLPADVGPCGATVPRWYHDYQTGQCDSFIWGGCGGNANNFETQQDCEDECTDVCRQPALQGDCQSAIPRWYHNELTGHCDTFTWGGCGGNGNNFQSVDDCRTACGDSCLLPPDPGPCDGICPRWYFNPGSGECETFIWGCCDGNENNFATQAECEQECAHFLP